MRQRGFAGRGGSIGHHIDRIVVRRERVCAWHLLSQLQRAHPCLEPKTWACTVGRLDAYCRVAAALVQLEIHLGVRVGVVHLRVSLPPWPLVCQL